MTKKPDVYEIDLLKMELEKKLPHWLDPMQRYPEMAEAIRMKHREQWLAEQEKEKEKKQKAWKHIKRHAESTLALAREFARDYETRGDFIQDPETGKLDGSHPGPGHGGGGGGGSSTSSDTGGASDPESASALLKPEKVSLGEVVASVPGADKAIASARAKIAAGVPTDAPVAKGGHKNPDGSWTAERSAVHDRILAKIFSPEAVAAATPKPGEQPVLHHLGGRGGSGKGWFTSAKGTVPKGALFLNNDDVKEALPEYQGWNAALLHEESSYIGDVAELMARDMKLNIIIDGTMKTGASVIRRVDVYKKSGYRTVGHYMYTSPATSAKRALERFTRGGETGRFVPPEYTMNSVTNEQSFDAVRPKLDAWEIYDNSGSSPKLHSRSKA